MKHILPLLALAAAALAGCNQTSAEEAAAANAAAEANAIANVKLPPSIVASHKYRCGDNSVIAVDWKSDGTVNSALVTPEGGTGTIVTQAAADGDYAAEGATLTGDPQATSVTYNGKSCKR
ncbi:hypothetical protein [Sphingomonas mesophila]|uniref:hypothetical protein n=1 Tax=Sphingomonas mesophila TaxID=2303576 RepID=UPI000E585918|nr:hypothetical protein [Sphingomonas mesophila]